MKLSEKEKNEILLKLVADLNDYLLKRWEKLPNEAKGILGLNREGWEGQQSRDFVQSQWSNDFYKQRILELEDELKSTKRYLSEVIYNTNYC